MAYKTIEYGIPGCSKVISCSAVHIFLVCSELSIDIETCCIKNCFQKPVVLRILCFMYSRLKVSEMVLLTCKLVIRYLKILPVAYNFFGVDLIRICKDTSAENQQKIGNGQQRERKGQMKDSSKGAASSPSSDAYLWQHFWQRRKTKVAIVNRSLRQAVYEHASLCSV